MKRNIANIAILFSLGLSLLIYFSWRTSSLSSILQSIHFSSGTLITDLAAHLSLMEMPVWFIYSVPDGLWMFAFSLYILSVWEFDWSGIGRFWYALVFIIGCGSEILQSFTLFPGTFDWCDMGFIISGSLLSLVFVNRKLGI